MVFKNRSVACSIYQVIKHNYRDAVLVKAAVYAFRTSSSESSQFGIDIPNAASSFRQLRTELSGRRAAVGYWVLVIGTNRGCGVPSTFEARSKIAFANPNQDVEPLSVK